MNEPIDAGRQPQNLGAEVAYLTMEIMHEHPNCPTHAARQLARAIVVAGRTAIEEIRRHGKLAR